MSWRGVLLFLCLVAGLSRPVSAQTLSVSYKIHVRARVLPAQVIIVNPAGRIIRVDSNTSQSVEPQIFLNKISPANQIRLSASIKHQYQQILASSGIHAGTIYNVRVQSLKAALLNYRLTLS